MRNLSAELEQRQANHLYRRRKLLDGPQGPRVQWQGRSMLAFCSNDYLGLANHPSIVAALQEGAARYGVGSGASHLILGHSRAHHELELELADFTGRERALLFSSGYAANLGVISSLVDRHDEVWQDRLNHASLLDGAILSRAKLKRYAHCDGDKLELQLANSTARHRLVVTDGVFSMDGDMAPLPKLAQLCQQQNADLMVDDAHGLGVLGPNGAGSVAHFRLSQNDVPVYMGTLGKALGTSGAFVAGSADLIEYLIQQARTYIYTTAMPPAVAHATLASLRLARSEAWRRETLQNLIGLFRGQANREGWQLLPSQTAIQPVIIGDSERAVAVSQELEKAGILVPAIRPPTVPAGTARLRVTFSAAHTTADVAQLVEALRRAL